MSEQVLSSRYLDDLIAKSAVPTKSEQRGGPAKPIAPTSGGYVVGAANERAERLADRVADRGMATLRNDLGTAVPEAHRIATVTSGDSKIRRSTTAVTPSTPGSIGPAGGETDSTLSAEIDAARGGGRRLERGVRATVQRAIGHDMSDVKIHTDARADRVAERIQARAFTVGRDIFFADGNYRPETTGGMNTLLHESAHVMEAGTTVQRQVIRRLLTTTTEDFNRNFPKGKVEDVTKGSNADPIFETRAMLNEYHLMEDDDPRRIGVLKDLIWWVEAWIAVQPNKMSDSKASARSGIMNTILLDAQKEVTKTHSDQEYLQAGRARAGIADASTIGKPVKPFVNLQQIQAFDNAKYEQRADMTNKSNPGYQARKNRPADLKKVDEQTENALTKGIESLSHPEYAALNAYTSGDYKYINPNVGGWGRGHFDSTSADTDRAAEGKENKQKYEEAGLHAAYINDAFHKLPVWTGTTYRGMASDKDFLGVTTKGEYQANDLWSTSEAKVKAQDFVDTSAGPEATMAIICTIQVTNGRDVARLSDSPQELEILLAPGSVYKISQRKCLTRGKDDDAIKAAFTDKPFKNNPSLTQFWVIELVQHASNEKQPDEKEPNEKVPNLEAVKNQPPVLGDVGAPSPQRPRSNAMVPNLKAVKNQPRVQPDMNAPSSRRARSNATSTRTSPK